MVVVNPTSLYFVGTISDAIPVGWVSFVKVHKKYLIFDNILPSLTETIN